MNEVSPPSWNKFSDIEHVDKVIDGSSNKPVLVFKHESTSPESVEIVKKLEGEWDISADHLDIYMVDGSTEKDKSDHVAELSGVDDEYPQVLLFADGVTMYDESHEMINVKKINIALKIINRTFRWMESRA